MLQPDQSIFFGDGAKETNRSTLKAKQGFREFHAALRTIRRYEAMHMIRKWRARRVNGSDVWQQIQFLNQLFGVVA